VTVSPTGSRSVTGTPVPSTSGPEVTSSTP
jgi:hypothetical protein